MRNTFFLLSKDMIEDLLAVDFIIDALGHLPSGLCEAKPRSGDAPCPLDRWLQRAL